MNAHYHSVYLSPHLDDAILSCGGQIYQQTLAGKSVLIVTVTAGDPPPEPVSGFASSLHRRWRLDADVVEKRRIEDIAACTMVGADYLHWDLVDCIYRRHPATGKVLYHSEADIFGKLHPAEAPLVNAVAKRMANLPSYDRVVIPLAVGNHVDHQLTRQAAEQQFDPAEVVYYEEYPYAQKKGALAEALNQNMSWQSEVIPLTAAALDTKLEAILCYRSQISTFFDDRDDLVTRVVGFSYSIGGERLWIR